MIFNSKQLEELENIHDSTGAFEEEADDEAGFDDVGEAAMDWRRSVIEEAAENVKRAKTRQVEPHITYPIGSMLYDRDARRFARVQRSIPGYLKIVYLAGGDREYGNLDVIAYLRDQGAQKRLSELSEQLGMSDHDVAHELERLGITPIEEPETPEDVAAAAAAADAAAAGPEQTVAAPQGPASVLNAKAATNTKKAAPLPKPKHEPVAVPQVEEPTRAKNQKAAPAPAAKPAAKPAKAAAPAPKAAKAPPAPPVKGAKVNPIDDPNGYIKAHYHEMSNRELARLTGLSEHTIRRKLGEWSLKRKNPL